MNSSVKNVYTGEVYQQLDDIYSYLLEFNTKNMARDECVNEDIKNNQEMKEDVIKVMFEGTEDLPQTIPWSVCQGS